MRKLLKLCIMPILLLLIVLSSNKNVTLTQDRKLYYGQRVERASEYLMVRANIDSVTSYEDGNMHEMYTFNHPETLQSSELTDYRYIGNDSNNYVYFNCTDESKLDTCELWRIIGVFRVEDEFGNLEYRLKIMRNESIGKYAWNVNYTNDWNNSSLVSILNEGNFWNSLTSKAQDMVDLTKFYIGGEANLNLSGDKYYQAERGVKSYNDYPVDYIGNVGLILPSDYSYSYALGVDDTCFNNIYACNNQDRSWLGDKDTLWTMMPTSNSNNAYIIGNELSQSSSQVTSSYDVYPTFYLKYNIVIESGNGSEGDAYILRLMDDSDIQSEMEMIENIDDVGEKSVVYVNDTSSIISNIILFVSITIIILGTGVLLFNYYKSKREIK